MILEAEALDRFTFAYLIELDTPALIYHRLKRSVGRVLAAFLLMGTFPLIVLLVLLVRLTSRGPGIHGQTRLGRHGRCFVMYKIRTMVHNAEAGTGPVWSAGKDPRVTRVGTILRRLHLDELPQLYNVLRGDMVLIGPRPERPEIVRVLSSQIPDYASRLAVPPGITGLAQINLPSDSDLGSVRRKLLLDLKYIRSANPLLDLRILVATALRVMGIPRLWAVRTLGLRTPVTLRDHPVDSYVPDFAPAAITASLGSRGRLSPRGRAQAVVAK